MPGHVPDKYIHHVIVTDNLPLCESLDEAEEIVRWSDLPLTIKVGDTADTVVIKPEHNRKAMEGIITVHMRSNYDKGKDKDRRQQSERRDAPREGEDPRRVHGERRHE
jgi:hypothetical protein